MNTAIDNYFNSSYKNVVSFFAKEEKISISELKEIINLIEIKIIMDYFLKASAIITLFYLCYKVFLQGETFFQSNRWFLLIGLFFAIFSPLLIIPIYIEYVPVPINFSEFEGITTQQVETSEYQFNFFSLLTYIYSIGVVFLFAKLLIQLYSLKTLFKSNKNIRNGNYVFIETDKETTPFRFLIVSSTTQNFFLKMSCNTLFRTKKHMPHNFIL